MPAQQNIAARNSSSFSDLLRGSTAPQLLCEMRDSLRMERQKQKLANTTIT
jgi:hypothetical protein